MQPVKRFRFKWGVRISLLIFSVWFAWSLFGFHVREPGKFISAAEAESIVDIKLPPEAENIRAASYSQLVEYAQYLRFEAPVEVCLRTASAVVPNASTRPAEDYERASDIQPLRANAFRDFSWFDLDKATDVITAGGGPSQPQVWVDRYRGVFYYRKTD